MLQELLWLAWCGVAIAITMYFNAWVIPFVVVIMWPEFVGERMPLSHSGAALIAWSCCAAGIIFSRGIIAVLLGMFLGKKYADWARGQ